MEDRPREGPAANVRAFDATLRRGEVDLALEGFAANGVLLVPSRPPLVGPRAMRADLAALAERLTGLGPAEPEVLEDGPRAIALIEGAAGGAPVAEIFSFEGDRIRQLRVLFDTASK